MWIVNLEERKNYKSTVLYLHFDFVDYKSTAQYFRIANPEERKITNPEEQKITNREERIVSIKQKISFFD